MVAVGNNKDDIVVVVVPRASFLRNFDAKAMPTHEHCMPKAKKSMRKSRLRRIIDEFDFVRKSLRKAGTRQTAFMISKLRAASNLGKI